MFSNKSMKRVRVFNLAAIAYQLMLVVQVLTSIFGWNILSMAHAQCAQPGQSSGWSSQGPVYDNCVQAANRYAYRVAMERREQHALGLKLATAVLSNDSEGTQTAIQELDFYKKNKPADIGAEHRADFIALKEIVTKSDDVSKVELVKQLGYGIHSREILGAAVRACHPNVTKEALKYTYDFAQPLYYDDSIVKLSGGFNIFNDDTEASEQRTGDLYQVVDRWIEGYQKLVKKAGKKPEAILLSHELENCIKTKAVLTEAKSIRDLALAQRLEQDRAARKAIEAKRKLEKKKNVVSDSSEAY